MTDQYLFGKDFNRSFIATENSRPINLPTQTPTIYIFDAKPNRASAADGTGAVATISTWNEGAVSPYPNVYTVTGINDPDPDGTTASYWYWEAINYITKTAGTAQTAVRAFQLCRALTPSSYPSITAADLVEVYPAIKSYLSDTQLEGIIDNCLEEMVLEFEATGLEFGKFSDLKKLRLPLAYKCISEGSFTQFVSEGDKFHIRHLRYKEKYENLLKLIPLPYDADGDGQPETVEQVRRSYRILDT